MEKQTTLDRLEEKILFRVSRFFFLSLAMISMLVLLIGAIYLAWSLIPVNRAPDPRDVILTAKDVRENLESNGNAGNLASTENANAENSKTPDELKLDSYIDTLKQLMPPPEYSWDAKGYYTKDAFSQYVTTDIGLTQRLKDFTDQLSDVEESNQALSQLCSVLREFPQDGRLKPLESFTELYLQKRNDRFELVKSIDSQYETALAEKVAGKSESLIVIVSAVSTMAFLAIFLVLLSVQRSIKNLSAQSQSN
ncbi:MAG TPA: hypothetical protein VLX91_16470 [Candidatus Acidoferrales bacterium]|nr:hypothetical protein [Candidatus Acidoferrales bacterium]